MIIDEGDYVEHYGVKGMKWGVRDAEDEGGDRDSSAKDAASGGRKGGAKEAKPKSDKQAMKDEADARARAMKAKYGPDSMKSSKMPDRVQDREGFSGLTDGQKKAAIALGGIALIGGAAYLGNKYGAFDTLKMTPDQLRAFELDKLIESGNRHEFNAGMRYHWDKGLDLPNGTIFQRLSTVKETGIRPGGFYAAFDKADIERYKGELPTWWKRWGLTETSGYLTQLKAKEGIKAPSGKESFDIFKKLMDNDDILGFHPDVGYAKLVGLTPERRAQVVDAVAKKQWENFAVNWVNSNDPHVKKYFQMVKDQGYNALIDFNDAGRLSKTPVRLIDGKMFDVAGHIPVPKAELDAAKKNLKPLVMKHSDSIDEEADIRSPVAVVIDEPSMPFYEPPIEHSIISTQPLDPEPETQPRIWL